MSAWQTNAQRKLVNNHPMWSNTGAYNGDTVPEEFASIVAPHLQSYNYFLAHGMANVVAGLEPFEVLCIAF